MTYAINRLTAAINARYWVVHFKRQGKLYYKRFYDAKCGGSGKAKAAAIAWRDQKLKEVAALSVVGFHQQVRSNNVSGVAGVHFHRSAKQPSGFWQAAIRFHDGKRIARSFSVKKFGDEDAFVRASAARKQLLAMIEDRPYLKNKTAKRLTASKPP